MYIPVLSILSFQIMLAKKYLSLQYSYQSVVWALLLNSSSDLQTKELEIWVIVMVVLMSDSDQKEEMNFLGNILI